MNYKETLQTAMQSAWIIIKLVIPIYIIADILYYYNILERAAFVFEPFTSFLGLPPETALSIISGVFLNLYAAVAFAAPLDMDPHQWSVLAIFLGVCHSLPVESIIMKKLGIGNIYSYSLRFFGGLAIAYTAVLMPAEWFSATIATETFVQKQYENFGDLMRSSIYGAVELTLKIIVLIGILIFVMDFIKSRSFVKKSARMSLKVLLSL
ncbi:MAG: nucleoside recognition protein [Sulfurovum sp.]|nr:nucleoside recognition protein [Sulfurovum sp.]